jgi:hypothetical protein
MMLITDIHLVPAAPPQDFLQYYKGLISAEVVITLDAALCELHLKRCPHTEQLLEVCAKVKKWEDAMDIAMAEAEADYHCIDHLVGSCNSCNDCACVCVWCLGRNGTRMLRPSRLWPMLCS